MLVLTRDSDKSDAFVVSELFACYTAALFIKDKIGTTRLAMYLQTRYSKYPIDSKYILLSNKVVICILSRFGKCTTNEFEVHGKNICITRSITMMNVTLETCF